MYCISLHLISLLLLPSPLSLSIQFVLCSLCGPGGTHPRTSERWASSQPRSGSASYIMCHLGILVSSCHRPLAQPRDSTMREECAALDEQNLLLKEGKRSLRRTPKWILWELKLILIRLECMCILPRSPKRCTWIVMCLSVWYRTPT